METGHSPRARWRIVAAAHNLCILIGQIACQTSSLQTVNCQLRQARGWQKDIIENNSTALNSKNMWNTMKVVTNMEPSKPLICVKDDFAKANELNGFYLWFEMQDFSDECNLIVDSLVYDVDTRLEVDSSQVQLLFCQLCTKKSKGPDGISACLLKTCAVELTPVWCTLFQRSLDLHTSSCTLEKNLWLPQSQRNRTHLRIMIIDL